MSIKQLARDYRVKLTAQKIISFLPGSLGFNTNERIVRLTQGYLEDDYYERRIKKGIANINLLQKHGCKFSRKVVLEIGTGWHAIDLILFFLFGAKQLYTIDHHQHLDINVIRRVVDVFCKNEFIPKENLEDVKLYQDRINILRGIDKSNLSLNQFLETIQCQFYKRTAANITDINLENKVDIWYSESVLHRVPIKDLEATTHHIAANLLATDAYFFHRLDQKDINAQGHLDKSLWKFDYLKYSDFVYDNIISCRFNSQNRMRESDFIKLFKKNGLETLEVQSYVKEEDLERMKNFKVAAKFKDYDLRDLATAASLIIGKKGNG